MKNDELNSLLPKIKNIVQQAGKAILEIYEKNKEYSIELKSDGSPLTEADKIANQIIIDGLSEITPEIPILSEEGADIPYAERVLWEQYWLVDPLDGTREFLDRTGDFTVNIALIYKKQSILGVVYVPISNVCYYAARGIGAFKEENNFINKIQVALETPEKIRIVASRLHAKERLAVFLEKMPNYEITSIGSSLKFCLVAEGKADVYPRIGLTSEWDTAAAQCIVEQAGGFVIDLYGLPLHYNFSDSLLNPYFLVIGNKNINWQFYFPRESFLEK